MHMTQAEAIRVFLEVYRLEAEREEEREREAERDRSKERDRAWEGEKPDDIL